MSLIIILRNRKISNIIGAILFYLKFSDVRMKITLLFKCVHRIRYIRIESLIYQNVVKYIRIYLNVFRYVWIHFRQYIQIANVQSMKFLYA